MRSTACRTRAGDRRRSTARRRPSRPSCGTRPRLVARVDVFGRAVVVPAQRREALLHRRQGDERLERRTRRVRDLRGAVQHRRPLALEELEPLRLGEPAHEPRRPERGPRRHRHDPTGVRVEHHDRAGVRLQAAIRALVVHGPRALDARLQLFLGDPLDVEVEREPEVVAGLRGPGSNSRSTSPSEFTRNRS